MAVLEMIGITIVCSSASVNKCSSCTHCSRSCREDNDSALNCVDCWLMSK